MSVDELPNEARQTLIGRKARVQERPFVSRRPWLGPLIVRLRMAWNNMAGRWYVLAMFQQQNEFNDLTAAALFDHETRLIEQDQDQAALARQVAELRLQVRRLQQRMAALEADAASPDEGAS